MRAAAIYTRFYGDLSKISFDIDYWQGVAQHEYPNGLPESCSNDPTQWLFTGTITESNNPFQVATARLLGYSWPDQGKSTDGHLFPETEKDLERFIDEDGLVCVPAVAGERPPSRRICTA